eukprot:scaffold1836_cov56-Phaeocystis_antarctica.AAC.2
MVRVALVLSAAASSLAPSSPILLPAARGAHVTWARRARAAIRSGRRAAHTLRARACGGAARVGRGAAARTSEAQLGEGRVGLERGGQLLGPLVADPIPCGTRGARAVGAASACGERSGRRAARPTDTRARLRRCRGGGRGAAARTVEAQRGEGRVSLERGGQPLGPLVADVIVCGTQGRTRRGRGERVRQTLGAARRTPLRTRACAAVPRGVGGAPLHAPPSPSTVRVALALSAAASSLAPSSPISQPAARGGARAVGAVSACGVRSGRRAARTPHISACAAVPRGGGGAPLHAQWRSRKVRVVLVLSAAASSLAPSSPISLSAAHGAHAPWARRARAACARGGAPHAPPTHARVRGGAAGVGRGAAARTVEDQLGEGRVGLERGGQLLGPFGADVTACGTRGRTRGGRGERVRQTLGAARRTPLCACAAVPRGWGGAPLHALPRFSSVQPWRIFSSASASDST